MDDRSPPFTWQDLFFAWTLTRSTHDYYVPASVRFTEILLPSHEGYLKIGSGIVDWWPAEQVSRRRSALSRGGSLGAYWRPRKGTLHTAELLYECKDNLELQVAVLIAASAWDKRNTLPYSWRGDVSRLLQQVLEVILDRPDSPFRQHHLPAWHHRMRDALPMTIINEEFAECTRPRNYKDFVHIAFIESILATTIWTLVLVSDDRRGLRPV